ncbi:MAG TPA: UDP-N-acetylglucosamine 2-epimerase (hydrolyzing) [Methylophaga sp.]|nr:UDP-N-acetylglucosamine 2-epimerase (hydrolyzing) [Methylophaga sp.]
MIDEPIRHSITKMSHLHFAATDYYAQRIIQMGEEPWRVTMSGAPSLDNIHNSNMLKSSELKDRYGIDLAEPTLIVTFHPVTLDYENTEGHLNELLAALEKSEYSVVFTYPNADTQGRLIIKMIQQFVDEHRNALIVDNLGIEAYFGLLNNATAMVGNSSSGIIEAASFKLPVVNIGDRQRGRIHGKNVIDVGNSQSEILKGIKKATSSSFLSSLEGLVNPYGDGFSSEMIVNTLGSVQLNDQLLYKKFFDTGDRL